jgi:HEAT repeat protein
MIEHDSPSGADIYSLPVQRSGRVERPGPPARILSFAEGQRWREETGARSAAAGFMDRLSRETDAFFSRQRNRVQVTVEDGILTHSSQHDVGGRSLVIEHDFLQNASTDDPTQAVEVALTVFERDGHIAREVICGVVKEEDNRVFFASHRVDNDAAPRDVVEQRSVTTKRLKAREAIAPYLDFITRMKGQVLEEDDPVSVEHLWQEFLDSGDTPPDA